MRYVFMTDEFEVIEKQREVLERYTLSDFKWVSKPTVSVIEETAKLIEGLDV